MSEQITIKIWTGSTAFEHAPGEEIARLLHGLAASFEFEDYPFGLSGPLRDSYGSTVGQVIVAVVHDEAGEP